MPPRCHAGAFAVAAPVAAAERSADSDISDFMLDNGMEVVVIPDHRAPIVTHMVWYKVGSADEPPGKSGIAHFFEHLMFKGTTNHKPGEFGAKVAEIGGSENAFTSWDYTAFYQTVSPDALQTMMSYEADRMRNLILTDEVIGPERDVILEERRSRIENSPEALLVGGGRRDALPEPALPHPGDRLDARDGAAEPRRRDRLLRQVLRAQQRGAGGGRRCRRRDRARRSPKRPTARCRAARTCRRASARPSRSRTPSAR